MPSFSMRIMELKIFYLKTCDIIGSSLFHLLVSWCAFESESFAKVYEMGSKGNLLLNERNYYTFQITHIFVDDGGIAQRLESCGDLSSQIS